nr:class E sortase [Tissierella sp.]
MEKRKIIGFIIIIFGILIVAYPISLRMQANKDQKKLRGEFEETKKIVSEEIKEENKDLENKDLENKDLEQKDKKEEIRISYDAWPETLMRIPKIDVEAVVVEMEASDIDVFAANANYPPAHYRNTDFPGGKSNVAIAAHRTGPADYFRHLDRLEEGDYITLETTKSFHEYIVERVFIVDPTDNSVIKGTDYGALTLTSCEREDGISNKKRIIVRARLKDEDLDKKNK